MNGVWFFNGKIIMQRQKTTIRYIEEPINQVIFAFQWPKWAIDTLNEMISNGNSINEARETVSRILDSEREKSQCHFQL